MVAPMFGVAGSVVFLAAPRHLGEMAMATRRLKVNAEITLKDALALLKIKKDKQGRTWDRVVTVIRDPTDLTRIIGTTVHEAA